jgi:hypothetical protein
MRTGMYQRNIVTDTVLPRISPRGGHAGNRAIPIDLWDRFESLLHEAPGTNGWGLEAGLNALVTDNEAFGTFVMYGVVNIGSRIKAGGGLKGVRRMAGIHGQAPVTRQRFRRP